MIDPPDEFVAAVRELQPRLVALIGPGPAAELGRLGAADNVRPPRQTVRRLAAHRLGNSAAEPVALTALRDLGPLPAERLLGALEVTIAGLELPALPAAPAAPASVPAPPPGTGLAIVSAGQDSAAVTAAVLLERLRPGSADAVLALTRRLGSLLPPTADPVAGKAAGGEAAGERADSGKAASGEAAGEETASGTAASSEAAGGETGGVETGCGKAADSEAEIAAAHGARWLALAVAAACAVTAQADPPVIVERPAATAGLAVGAAATVLRGLPMPSGYDAALLSRIRDEYLLPRHSYGTVPVTAHRFALTEGNFPTVPDFAGNGLVTVAGGGAAIRTGAAEGPIRVHLSVLADPPADVEPGWDEIVEVGWHAPAGRASVLGPDGPSDPQLRHATPPWPGDYRLRVHARGRDDAEDPDAPDTEMFSLVVWAAPPAPVIVHRRTDRLGHRLRGEPEPERPVRPEHAYRWIRRTALAIGATVTVVTASTPAEVLRAFGADPDRPEPVASIEDSPHPGPWVAVHDAGGAVVAVEFNGYQGSHAAVLKAASAHGRAASMFWNERALTRLSFAEGGELLAAFEPWQDVDAEPRVAAALSGLDFAAPGLRAEKGLVAVERFTGCGLTPAMLERIRAGHGHRITAA
ncbi:DUF6461 domain-containing protein [Actinoplanes regularis]|uniref:DUF6461 domain-containing protein n=1 Tax=Actinoplanes regularis TaxID=52697 RepID=UPI0024A4EFE8|nr:DUF6461 domain-containing protein [Actinoplanes regularis]GLW34509.1 hypothetical protein Areg01_74460 [Actinoplanes regularis]